MEIFVFTDRDKLVLLYYLYLLIVSLLKNLFDILASIPLHIPDILLNLYNNE